MKTSSHIRYGNYIINKKTLRYKAVWNCQVAWTDECIYYDAETGIVSVEKDSVEFISDDQHHVTKDEYIKHTKELETLEELTLDKILQYTTTSASSR